MARKILVFLILIGNALLGNAQTQTSGRELYRAAHTQSVELIHTKLSVSFSLSKRELYGEEWLTATPYFYPSDSIVLDAKNMLIHQVALHNGKKNRPLQFTHKENLLHIKLDKTYQKAEPYTLYIRYTAQPYASKKSQGAEAIKESRGLYFINPEGEDPEVPTQIWTQGEVEASSCWFPTVDKPNQKTTQEIFITVPDRFVTLSNGILQESKKLPNGERTDHWVMDKRHATYLFFMGIGEYSVVKDKPWRNVPIDYYVEKKYENVAQQIFGNTAEMIAFFSQLLHYDFPWQKYAQITAREYVSGAMENTTAVIHAEYAQQTAKQLADENYWESTIAHELFHHWFGDLVTAESWANLPMNESFANYSEYLWFEHKYGKDVADYHLEQDIDRYKHNSADFHKKLVRFGYTSKEDMFDLVSYNKGGAILHMLRDYLGDEAFFQGIALYLKTNEYGTGEAHQFRLALEKISGKDLNWFFNQWFFNYGNPKITTEKNYDSSRGELTLKVLQDKELPFQFPLEVDIYAGGGYQRYKVWASAKAENIFVFPTKKNPDLVNVNPRGVLLCQENSPKTVQEYDFQYRNAKDYKSRSQVVQYAAEHQQHDLLAQALGDAFFRIRIAALKGFNPKQISKNTLKKIEKMATSDPENLVKAAAIGVLASTKDAQYFPIFERGLEAFSQAVNAASVQAISLVSPQYWEKNLQKIDLSLLTMDEILSLLPQIVAQKNPQHLPYVWEVAMFFPFVQDATQAQAAQQAYVWVMQEGNTQIIRQMAKTFEQFRKEVENPQAQQVMRQILAKGIEMKQQLAQEDTQNADLQKQIQILTQVQEGYK